MRIYLASRFSRRDEMLGYKAKMEDVGHECSARWLTMETDSRAATEEQCGEWAIMEMEDVSKSDALITFTEEPNVEGAGRGGRHVEFGAAIAMNKRVIVVGPRENLFHHLPGLEVLETFDKALEALEREG